MTESEVRALVADMRSVMVALARIEGDVKAIRDDNAEGKDAHKDFETRIRALERVRWLVAGAAAVLGSGVGAAVSHLLG